jgi:hypothetical protein
VNTREKVTGIDEYRLIFKLKLVCHTYNALSGTTIRRKHHESVMSLVMNGKCGHRFAIKPFTLRRHTPFPTLSRSGFSYAERTMKGPRQPAL